MKVLVTGAGGNLGAKAVDLLSEADWCHEIVAFYWPAAPQPTSSKVTAVVADLTRADGDWRRHLSDIDAVLHFAAVNPVPDADWSQAAASFDLTANIGLAAAENNVRRFVFCSSNHVMGRYKDDLLAATLSPGGLHPDLAPAPGTRWHDGTKIMDATAYSASKLMAERFVSSMAVASHGRLTALSLRIGWNQPDENCAKTITISGSHAGTSNAEIRDAEAKRTLRWFRNMWLSNADFLRLIEASLRSDGSSWPKPHLIINGVSANEGTDWSLEAGKIIGYRPVDDARQEIGAI